MDWVLLAALVTRDLKTEIKYRVICSIHSYKASPVLPTTKLYLFHCFFDFINILSLFNSGRVYSIDSEIESDIKGTIYLSIARLVLSNIGYKTKF